MTDDTMSREEDIEKLREAMKGPIPPLVNPRAYWVHEEGLYFIVDDKQHVIVMGPKQFGRWVQERPGSKIQVVRHVGD